MKFRILFGAAMMVASSGGGGYRDWWVPQVSPAQTRRTLPMAYTCTGGDFATGNFTSIPSGTYASITVKGACAEHQMP